MKLAPKAFQATAATALAAIASAKSPEEARKAFVTFEDDSGLGPAFSALVHGPRLTGPALAKAQAAFLRSRHLLTRRAVPLFEKFFRTKDMIELAAVVSEIQRIPAETDFLKTFQLAVPLAQEVMGRAVKATHSSLIDLVDPWTEPEPEPEAQSSHQGAANGGALGAGFGAVVGGALGAGAGPITAAAGAVAGAGIFGAIGAVFGDFFDRGRDDADDDADGGEAGGDGEGEDD